MSSNRDLQARVDRRNHPPATRSGQPDCPVFIVAKSGGSGVAVKALELLDEQTVERVVLLAPALSPRYDLTGALRAVRREMVVFWSPFDLIILGAGTRVFGTMDRVKTVGAGWSVFGFPPLDHSDAARSLAYAKLRQVRWRPLMVGHRLLRRSPGTRFSFLPEKVRCAAVAG